MSPNITTERQLFNPFPGLRPFETDEAHLYFGRDGQSDEIIRRLVRTHFVGVVGTSGSGKSSLVRAGLLPALHGGFMSTAGSSWRVAIFRPGNNPIRNLATALIRPDVFGSREQDEQIATAVLEATLRRSALGLVEATRLAGMASDEQLLVVVDQFEELFRFKKDSKDLGSQDEAAAFVKLLLEAAHETDMPIYVVMTMRSDYLGDCSQFRDLPEALNDGQYLVPRMTRDQRREAIEGPVAVGGGDIAPRLVQRLLNDVGDDPDQLPILQHALMRTWDHWQKDRRGETVIDLVDYEAIGGLSQALDQHADEAYNGLDRRGKEIAEKLFKCLTEKDADNRKIRRATTLEQIRGVAEAEQQEVVNVIDRFRKDGHWFLTPPVGEELTRGKLIDISHESLIRRWNRLHMWVEQELDDKKLYLRLVEAAERRRIGKGGLWRNPDLKEALDWLRMVKPNRSWASFYDSRFDSVMNFLKESKKRSIILKIVAGIAATALTLGGYAFGAFQLQIAQEERRFAEKQRAQAEVARAQAEENLHSLLKQFGWKDIPSYATRETGSTTTVKQSLSANQALERNATPDKRGRRSDTVVEYFPKDVDENKVESALKELGFKFEKKGAPITDIPTNAIWFGSPVRIEDVKLVAYTLIRAGVQIRGILPFLSERKDQALIQVGAYRAIANEPPLTVEAIQAAESFRR